MFFPEDLKYSDEHEWAAIEGKIVTLGITDFAQHELGDIVGVEFNVEDGDEVEKGDEVCYIDSHKSSNSVFAAVSGKVVEINETLVDNPELINDDPYGEGWMVKIRVENDEEFSELMTAAEYEEYAESEAESEEEEEEEEFEDEE